MLHHGSPSRPQQLKSERAVRLAGNYTARSWTPTDESGPLIESAGSESNPLDDGHTGCMQLAQVGQLIAQPARFP